MRCPRATLARASSISAPGSATASDQESGTRSRTRPPSSRCTGTPSARPLRSQSAISTAARANGLPCTRRAISRRNRLDARRVAPDQPRRDIALDGGGDGLRGLLAPRRPAQARRLAPSHEPVRCLQPHEDEVHRLEGREGHLVRALDRDVGLDHPHVGDLHAAISSRIACLRSERVGCWWTRPARNRASGDASISMLPARPSSTISVARTPTGTCTKAGLGHSFKEGARRRGPTLAKNEG